MKKLILAVALTLSAPVLAEVFDKTRYCTTVGNYAAVIMETRQLGGPLSESLPSAGSEPMFIKIVMDAYSSPHYMLMEPYHTNAITEHGNKWMLYCLRN